MSTSKAAGKRDSRTEAEVYAAESRAAAKAAEEKWNERIRAAYASVAASTPFRPKTETKHKAGVPQAFGYTRYITAESQAAMVILHSVIFPKCRCMAASHA
jgi:hypothetical protein